jgi:hypothetical protein
MLIMPVNNAFERTSVHRDRAVLAMDCVLGGAERPPCQAAQIVQLMLESGFALAGMSWV